MSEWMRPLSLPIPNWDDRYRQPSAVYYSPNQTPITPYVPSPGLTLVSEKYRARLLGRNYGSLLVPIAQDQEPLVFDAILMENGSDRILLENDSGVVLEES